MKTFMQLDVSDLTIKMNEFSRRVSPGTFEKVYRYTFKDIGRETKKLVKRPIMKQYRAKPGRIKSAIKKPIIQTSGKIVLMIPVKAPRGTIGNKKCAYGATPRPEGMILRAGNSLLPTSGDRKHFYIPSGKLAGHVFVRHSDGKVWRGVRRQTIKEPYKDKAGKKRKRKKLEEQGTRTRVGTISHGVGIAIPQMPMNRAAPEVQEAVLRYGGKQFEKYAMQALSGGI